MVSANNSQDSTWTPCDVTGVVRAPHGNLQCFSYSTGPVWDPQGCRTTHLHTTLKATDTPRIDKNPARALSVAVRGSTDPLRPHTGCLRALNPYGTRKLIMHALKLYGPRTERQNSYRAVRVPWVNVRFLFKTAQEQPVRDPGVWCDWGISKVLKFFTERAAAFSVPKFPFATIILRCLC